MWGSEFSTISCLIETVAQCHAIKVELLEQGSAQLSRTHRAHWTDIRGRPGAGVKYVAATALWALCGDKRCEIVRTEE